MEDADEIVFQECLKKMLSETRIYSDLKSNNNYNKMHIN